jgi:hypothetical protein
MGRHQKVTINYAAGAAEPAMAALGRLLDAGRG